MGRPLGMAHAALDRSIGPPKHELEHGLTQAWLDAVPGPSRVVNMPPAPFRLGYPTHMPGYPRQERDLRWPESPIGFNVAEEPDCLDTMLTALGKLTYLSA